MATIDERVVSLKMSNKQFLSAIKESASGMDKLKESLKMQGAADGLARVGEIAKNTTLGDLAAKALEIGKNMTVMQGLGLAAFGGIGAAALSAGKNIMSGFFQTVKDGFNEYELKMRAIQTIMANTAEKGTTLTEVKASLAELNTYADRTVYSFSDMTNAIGLFTAAGVDLQTSVNSIKGLSNLAAASGSTAQQTATAYTQLSQAISAGVVHLQDWNSLVNAGMGGESFRNALIETARMMGTGVDAAIQKQGSFRESLKEDWLTAQVMTTTLTAMTNDLSEAQLMEMGYSEEQAKKLKLFASNAFDAATKVRTFSQLIDTTKEAIGSGWADTFEILFGDFEEASDLFTHISDWLGAVISDSARARNGFLQMWKDMGGRKDLIQGLSNIFDAIVKVLGQIGTAFQRVFMNVGAESLVRITKAFADFTSKLIITNNFADKLEWTFTGLFSVFHIFATVIGEIAQVIFTVAAHIIGAFFPAVAGINSGVFQVTKVIGKAIYWFDQWFTKLDLGGKVLKLLLPPIDLVGKAIKWVVEAIHSFIMWIDFGGKVAKVGDSLKNLASKFGLVKEALRNSVIGQQFTAAMDSFHNGIDKAKTKINEFATSVGDKLKTKLMASQSALVNYFKGFNFGDMTSSEAIVSALGEAFDKLGNKLKISEKVEWLKEKLVELKNEIVEAWRVVQNSSAWDKLGDAFAKAGDKVKGLAKSFQEWVNGHGQVKQAAQEAAGAVAGVGTATAQAAKDAGQAAKQNFILKWMDDIKRMADQLHLPEIFESIKQKLIEIKEAFQTEIGPKIKEAASKAFGGIGDAASKANENLKSYDMGKIIMTILGGGAIVAITRWMNSFKENFDKIGGLADKLKEFFGKLTETLDAFIEQIKAEALKQIAIALIILAGALLIMALIPFNKLVKGLAAMGILFKAMSSSLKELEKRDADKLKGIAGVLTLLAVGMVIMAVAIKMLGNMNPGAALQGVIALAIILKVLTGFMETVQKNAKRMKPSAGILMGLAVSCVILAGAVYMLGSMDSGKAIQGVIALAAVIGLLTGFMFVVSKDQYMGKGAAVLMGLAIACNILVSAIWMLGTMDTGKLLQGMIAVTVLITELSVAMAIAGRTNPKGAASILAMAVAVTVLVGAVYMLGNMNIGTLAKGLISLAVGLGILAIAMAAADAFKDGAVAIGIASVSFIILANALKQLSTLSWGQLAIGLIALAGGFTVLLAAAFVAQMVAPGLVILTAALLALGLALLPISIGLAAFAAVLGICATTGAAAFLVLGEGLKQLGAILPQLAVDLATAIAAFIVTLGEQAPAIGVAMAQLLGAIIFAINANIPGIVEMLFILISAMLTELGNHAYEFGAKGAQILADFLQGIADNIGKVVESATNLIINFLDGIGQNAGRIVDKGLWTILKLLEGVRDGITKYAPKFRKVGGEIAWAIIDGVTGGLASKAWKIGSELVKGAKNGIQQLKDSLGIHSPSRVMKEIGGYMGDGLAIGIRDTNANIADASTSMGKTAYDALSKALDGVNDLLEDDPAYQPEIKPVLDLTELQKQANGLGSMMPAIGVTAQAANNARPAAPIAVDNSDKNSQNGVTNITFNQTNNSPEALDAATIYRQTKTQLAMAKDKLTL